MPAINHYVRDKVEQRRRIATFAFFIVWFFALIVIDLGTDAPFAYTTVGWFAFILVVLAVLNERIQK